MKSLHFIGIGGIGMSGLAACCCDLGIQVTGSDRGADRPENQRIIGALRNQGITIYPQDGSRFADAPAPEALVYSTAIEEDNPDFKVGQGIKRLHRSELLELVLEKMGKTSIAVTGSCGKSTVTAYLAEALTNLGADPACLNGALSKRFHCGKYAGNYRSGDGKYFVFEADESDKSLLRYTVDYAIVLNIGTDHYSREELARVFGEFLTHVRKGAVLERGVYEAVKSYLPEKLEIRVVDTAPHRDEPYSLLDYRIAPKLESVYCHGEKAELAPSGDRAAIDRCGAGNLLNLCGLHYEECRIERRAAIAEFSGDKQLELPQPGCHMAVNALCIDAMLEMLGFAPAEALEALERFEGVWRRSDFAGTTAKGALVYDDYAHNPEKILSCLAMMRELGTGAVYAVFQPHGYGPFGFMRDALFEQLEPFLKAGDRFILLEPFYAGGTSSFKPTAGEVLADWQGRSAHPEHYQRFPDRETLKDFLLLKPGPGDVIAIMGARDNSLSDYAASLVK